VPSSRILTGDEWEAAQYAPHRVGQDPTKPMGPGRILTGDEWEKAQSAGSVSTLQFPALPKVVQDGTQRSYGGFGPSSPRMVSVSGVAQSDAANRLNPNSGPLDRSIPEQLGAGVHNLAQGFDYAALGLDPTSAGAAHVVAALGRQVVEPAVEHPLVTAAMLNPVGAAIGTGMAVHTVAAYGWQKAHEFFMSPEERAKAEADPNRVSGEAAAVQAVFLGLGGLAAVKHVTDFGSGMVEAGAQGVKAADLGPGFTPEGIDAAETVRLQKEVNASSEANRQTAAMQVRINAENAARRDADAATQAALNAEDLRQEELTRQAALRALTGVRRRPAAEAAPYFETPKGAEVLGTAAAQHGLPETSSPYPPESPQDVAWQAGHAATTETFPEGFTMGGALTDNRIPSDYTPPKLPRGEPATPATPSAPGETASAGGPTYTGPASLYGRLSDDALGAEYRALLEKRTQEEPVAMAPLWTPEREARAVEQIENRRRPDGSLAPADKKRLAYLQLAEGEMYNVGRHTFESAAAEQRLNAVNKHITAIEKEIGLRGKDAADFAQPPAAGNGSLPPIEGTGETRTRGLATSVEQRAIAKDVTDYLGDLPEYRTVNMADQAAQASQLLSENPDLARQIALGDAPAPHGLIPEAVFKVVERKALEEGDVATLRDLASGGLTEQATTMGQRIAALADRDPESPVTAIQQVADARAAHLGDLTDATAKVMKEIEKTVNKANGNRADMLKTLSDFVDGLRC
jgi:hypothetical protein